MVLLHGRVRFFAEAGCLVPGARVIVVKIQVFDYCCPLKVEVGDPRGPPHHRLGSGVSGSRRFE